MAQWRRSLVITSILFAASAGLAAWPSAAPAMDYRYVVLEGEGENPILNDDYTLLSTLAEELDAGDNPNCVGDPCDPRNRFVEPEDTSYPEAYERISQLFDSDRTGDLIFVPKPYGHGDPMLPLEGSPCGNRGYLDVTQSRGVLIFRGPGVKAGHLSTHPAGVVDVAPTLCRLLGLPLLATGAGGRDEYLPVQDGRVIEDVLAPVGGGSTPERVVVLMLDGLSQTALLNALGWSESVPGVPIPAIPNLRMICEEGAMLLYGAVSNFPAYSFPDHCSFCSGAWSGHHGMVTGKYFDRAAGMAIFTTRYISNVEGLLFPEVETIHEVIDRAFGGAYTASVNDSCSRGADYFPWAGRGAGDPPIGKEVARLFLEGMTDIDWPLYGDRLLESMLDTLGTAQARALLLREDPPVKYLSISYFVIEGAGTRSGPHGDETACAIEETDRRIGRILETLEELGTLEDTLIVIASGHGMEIQDQTRSNDFRAVLDEAGIASEVTFGFVYLRCMDATLSHDLYHGMTVRELTVTVTEDDRRADGARRLIDPIGEARVVVVNGDGTEYGPFQPDCRGRVNLCQFVPTGERVLVRAEHPDFNPLEREFEVIQVADGSGEEPVPEVFAGDQGLSENEEPAAALATETLLALEGLDMVITARRDDDYGWVYEVRSERGWIRFIREEEEEDDEPGDGGCGACMVPGSRAFAPPTLLDILVLLLPFLWLLGLRINSRNIPRPLRIYFSLIGLQNRESL